MQPVDFTFFEKREPRRTFEQYAVEPPSNRFKRLWWNGSARSMRSAKVVELLWPEYDVITSIRLTLDALWPTTRNSFRASEEGYKLVASVVARVLPQSLFSKLTAPARSSSWLAA